MMTPNEFYSAMSDLYQKLSDDPEAFHVEADDLMCNLLNMLGYTKGVDIFLNADKYYS